MDYASQKITVWQFGLLAVLLLLPGVAMADVIDGFMDYMPGKDDQSYRFLKQLFGDFVCTVAKDTSCYLDPEKPALLVSALVTLSSIIFMLAGFIGGYVVIAGALNTGHTGELLGNSWHSLWVPFRSIVGVMLIYPNPLLAGLVPAQVVVIFVVLVSSGLANQTWKAVVDYTGTNTIISTPTGAINNNELHYDLATALLSFEVCTWSLYRQEKEASNNAKIDYRHKDITASARPWELDYKDWMPDHAKSSLSGHRSVVVRRITWSVAGFPADMCGTLRFPIKIQTQSDEKSGVLLANAIQYNNALLIDKLIVDMRRIAKRIVFPKSGAADSTAELASLFQQSVFEYDTRLRNDALRYFDLYKGKMVHKFKENAVKGGWVYAGTWFWRLAEMQRQVDSVVYDNLAKFNRYDPRDRWFNRLETYITDRLSRVDAIRAYIASNSGVLAEIDQMDSNGEHSWLDKAALAVSEMMLGVLQSDSAEHPLLMMKSLGSNMMAIAVGMTLWDDKPALLTLVQFILFALGGLLGTYVPLMPFIVFLFGIGGWLIMVINAMISAPVWGVLHLLPEGGGMTGQARAGYYQLLQLFLRPVLLLLGLISGFVLFYVMIAFLNNILFGFMALSGMNDFMHSLTIMFIYVAIVIALARQCFSLVYRVPSWVPQWYGGGQTDMVAPHSEEPGQELRNFGAFFAHIGRGQKNSVPEPMKTLPRQNSGGSGDDDGGGRGFGRPVAAQVNGTDDLMPEAHSHVPQDSTQGASHQAELPFDSQDTVSIPHGPGFDFDVYEQHQGAEDARDDGGVAGQNNGRHEQASVHEQDSAQNDGERHNQTQGPQHGTPLASRNEQPSRTDHSTEDLMPG